MFSVFFFNDTATTEIYTLSLHDALPISYIVQPNGHGYGTPQLEQPEPAKHPHPRRERQGDTQSIHPRRDRKSTRLNSSHANISYAVFCLKKKTKCCFVSLLLHMAKFVCM